MTDYQTGKDIARVEQQVAVLNSRLAQIEHALFGDNTETGEKKGNDEEQRQNH